MVNYQTNETSKLKAQYLRVNEKQWIHLRENGKKFPLVSMLAKEKFLRAQNVIFRT